MSDSSGERFDVVILGGAYSGAAAAMLLRRRLPHLSVLVVEKEAAFDLKVGESTTEMAAMFLTRHLGLWEHLERQQLPKEGLRFWFQNEHVTGHANASETGGFFRSPMPSFQLRRDLLDEHMLATAVALGAKLMRPATVCEVEIADFDHRVTVDRDGTPVTVSCRWVLDASGRARVLGRRLRLITRNDDHPIAAIWGRFSGVRHIDDFAAGGPGKLAARNVGSRRLGTNHYLGLGYWVWFIPLGGGETSIGVVFDKRLVDLHEDKDREAGFLALLHSIPAAAELLDEARLRPGDLRFYPHLPYVTRQYMGRGWALLGDAAAFLDPYYSPGLDHASFSVEATVSILEQDAAGKDIEAAVREHNENFVRSYHQFFEAVYRDKYYYMGEHDLLSASALLDVAQYYAFMVIPSYRFSGRFLAMPSLGHPKAFLSYRLLRLHNRRFKRIALARREAGEAGRRNHGRRVSFFFNLGLSPLRMFLRGLKLWTMAELDLVRLRVRVPRRPSSADS